ncbi:hypothetical protein GCM10023189_32100 [Nibrella saemangeumensis]|uniref:Exopolysaccharide biosynthesis protein YbjH n=1 Tax=Nibrella saemangeumensis TaxID=1084526 RepID=A0ABP8N061_9BACT
MKRTNYWLLLGSLLNGFFCQAQQEVSLRQRAQLLKNLENISVDQLANKVFYEQRLYRNPLFGLLEAKQALSANDSTEYVPLYQGVPIASYQLGTSFRTTILSKSERQAYYRANPLRWNQYKFDFRLHPEYMAFFGFREQPFQHKINLLLQSQLYLRRGLVLNWGVTFPLVNRLDNEPRSIRPAPIYLNQFLALDNRNYFSLSAGLFYSHQYGVNAQYRYTDLTRPWSFGLETGLTGFYYYPKTFLLYYEPMKQLLLLADVAYRVMSRDITIKLSGGQYLYQNRGIRLDFIRQFTNVEIGLFVSKMSDGTNAGFNFAVPIPPGRIAQTQRARIRTTEEFRWEYAYSQGNNMQLLYRVGNQLDALLRQYHHGYLRNQYQLYQNR